MFFIYAQEYVAKNLSYSSIVSCKIHEDQVYSHRKSLTRQRFRYRPWFCICLTSLTRAKPKEKMEFPA